MTAVVVMGAMVANTYNNQLISAAEEMEAATAMASVMAMVGGNSNVANNKLKAAAKETAVSVMAMATATATIGNKRTSLQRHCRRRRVLPSSL